MAKEMKLVGSHFTKMSAERNDNFKGKIELSQNLQINSFEKVEGSKEVIKVGYLLDIDYKELGKISIEGLVFVSADAKKVKEMVKSWEDKKLNAQEYAAITNLIIQKATIRALELEEEFRLPIHIRLPTVELKKN